MRGMDIDVDVTALRMWKLQFIQCALVLIATEHMKEGPSMELQALHVKCMLQNNIREFLHPRDT